MALKSYLEKDISKRPLTNTERSIAMSRKWKATYPDNDDPFIDPKKIIPPGLTKEEEDNYLRGSLSEAMSLYLKTLNTSRTKEDLNRKLEELGITVAYLAFSEKEQEGLRTVIKYLP
jgi:hypothetical protein